MKSYGVTIQMKPLEQYFHRVQIWPSNIKQNEIQSFVQLLILLGVKGVKL